LEYLLVIPTRLNNLNDYITADRTNRYKGAAMKARNEALVKVAIKQQMRSIRIERPVYMEYTWYERNKRRDLDNISSFGRKVIQDALVQTRVLVNDGWNEIVGFSDQFYVDAANPRIEVLIREVGDDG
jgi:Holliday junction resolvase RusA-like endonuclease